MNTAPGTVMQIQMPVTHVDERWNRNPNVDPVFCCSATARTWNIVGLILRIIGNVALFFLALVAMRSVNTLEELNGTSNPDKFDPHHHSSYPTEVTKYALKPIAPALLVISIISVILFSLSLYGVVKENLCLVNFWVGLAILDLLGSIILIIYICSAMPEIAKQPQIIASFISAIPSGIFCIVCAVAFRKRVKGRA